MVKVIATEDHLIIRQRIFIYMAIYYVFMGMGCYFLIQDPDITLGGLLAVMIPIGWFLGRPFCLTFTYDRKNKHIFRKSNWINYFTARREEESAAPDKWVIEVEYGTGDGPNHEAILLLEYGYRFLISHRNGDAEILASYVAHWEDVEVFYFESKLFWGRDQTVHRLYSKDHPGHIPSISEMNRVYLF
jgi:hypothetical protein